VSGWKTIVFNALCALLTLTDLMMASTLGVIIPPEWQIYWALFIVGGNVVLRWFTTGPIAGWRQKDEGDDDPVDP
jgi:hypothetical protein